MNARQRGDLAEQMLPVAANLSVLVHGEGGPEDVQEVLSSLSEEQRMALIVVLAGLVDPEQPLGKALGWLDFNEHGALTVPDWQNVATVRGLAVDSAPERLDEDSFIDEVAVDQYLKGKTSRVTPRERLEAVRKAAAMGVTYLDLDALHGLRLGSTATFISRIRKAFAVRGEAFPEMPSRVGETRNFSEEEVADIRERSSRGATDLELAMAFDVTSNTIGAICRGRTYAQFGGPVRKPKPAKAGRAARTVWGTSTPGFLEAEAS